MKHFFDPSVSGELRPPRAFVGYLFGGFVKRTVTSEGRPHARRIRTRSSGG